MGHFSFEHRNVLLSPLFVGSDAPGIFVCSKDNYLWPFYTWFFSHVVMCQLNMLLLLFFPSYRPLQTHLCSTKRRIYYPSIIFPQTILYLCYISYLHLFSCLHPTIHLIFVVSSIPLPHHVPFNYRTPYYSFDRLSISSICPDYSLKIKKIAMDQSK